MSEDTRLDDMLALAVVSGDLDNACQRILTAQPWQMTEAAARLDQCRVAMRDAVRDALLKFAKEPRP